MEVLKNWRAGDLDDLLSSSWEDIFFVFLVDIFLSARSFVQQVSTVYSSKNFCLL